MNPVGRCSVHPGIRCFYYAKRDWHFEIDNNCLSVWAHAINQVSVSMLV